MADDPAIITPTADPPSEPSIAPTSPPAQDDPVRDPGRENGAAPAEGGEPTGGDGDPDAQANLASLQTLIDEKTGAAFEDGRKKTQQRMDGHLQNQTRHMRSIDTATARLADEMVALKERAEDPDDTGVSMKDYNKLLKDNGEMFSALSNVRYEAGNWDGWTGLLHMIDERVLKTGELVEKFGPRIQNVANNDSDPTLLEDMVEAITGPAVKAALEADRPKTAKQARDNQAAELRNMARQDGAPPATPNGSAAGGARFTVKDIEKMTADKIAEIPVEELTKIMSSG